MHRSRRLPRSAIKTNGRRHYAAPVIRQARLLSELAQQGFGFVRLLWRAAFYHFVEQLACAFLVSDFLISDSQIEFGGHFRIVRIISRIAILSRLNALKAIEVDLRRRRRLGFGQIEFERNVRQIEIHGRRRRSGFGRARRDRRRLRHAWNFR